MFTTLAPPIAALAFFIAGALCVYVEFLRPGWIIPGAVGAALLVLALARFASGPVNLAGYASGAMAVVMFLMAAAVRSCSLSHFFNGIAGVLLVVSFVLLTTRLVGLSAGLPFAVLTCYLLEIALRARRNKTIAR